MGTLSVPRSLLWAGIALIGLTGLIHLIEAPEYLEEVPYLGVSFLLNVLGAALAAYGIYRDRSWGWALGIAMAGGAFVGYIVSRTVGLPGLTDAAFFETLGILSLLAEGLFTVLAAYVLSGDSRQSTGRSAASPEVGE